MKLLELSYEFFVILVGIIIYGTALIPPFFLVSWAWNYGFPWVVFALPAGFYIFLFCLILVAGMIKRLFVPRLKPGTYKFSKDTHVYVWFLNRTITEYVLVPFHRFVFLNDYMRYICMRLFGTKLHYSSVISTSYVSDFDLLTFGKNTLVGGWSVIYGHVETEPGTLVLAPVVVGESNIVGGRTSIACGTAIGDNNIIGFGSFIGLYSKIGNNCNIGIMCSLGHRVLIEDNVKIGKNSVIGTGVKIRKGTKLPDFSIIPDFATVNPDDPVKDFKIARHSDL